MTTIGGPGPQTVAPRTAPLPTKPDDALWSGPAFVDVLGGLPLPSNGASGFLEDADRTSPLDGKPAPNASVFNGHGLFYGVAADGSGSVATGSRSAAPAAVTTAAPTRALPAANADDVAVERLPPIAQQEIGDVIAEAVASADPTTVRVAPAVRVATPPSPANVVATDIKAASVVETDEPAVGARAARSERLTRFFDTVGVRKSVAVSLQAVDHGQAVVAQVGDLDREQRVKLRDRIVAELSRHGLAAASIRIDGHFAKPGTFEKDR